MLVSNRLYEKAYDMAMEYGIDMLAAASKVVLCENALKVQHVDDDFMVQLAISAFKTGKYSDLVLKYLCENYTGPTDELINLWHAADKFSISSMKLDERILEQGIYTQIEPEKISDIFMEFEKLKKIIAEVLNVDPDEITMETTFQDDLGADSLDVYQIIMGIEEEFDIEIPAESAEQVTTVEEAVEMIKNAVN